MGFAIETGTKTGLLVMQQPGSHVHQWQVLDILVGILWHPLRSIVIVNGIENLHIGSACCAAAHFPNINLSSSFLLHNTNVIIGSACHKTHSRSSFCSCFSILTAAHWLHMSTYHNHHFRRIVRIAQTGRYVKTKVGIVFNHCISTPYEHPALVLDNVLLQYGRQVRV